MGLLVLSVLDYCMHHCFELWLIILFSTHRHSVISAPRERSGYAAQSYCSGALRVALLCETVDCMLQSKGEGLYFICFIDFRSYRRLEKAEVRT